MNKLAVVILNWNGKDLLEKFLPSVVANSKQEWAEIVIADNASTDDSIAFLHKYYPNIQIISLDKNYGFAEGYNRALSQLNHCYFVLLNSDVEVSENWLEPIYYLFEKDNTIAAAQPKIKSYHEKNKFEYAGAAGGFLDYLGYPFCRGRILDQIEEDHGQYNTREDIFWASGAALFIRSNIYNEVGGLDADFFAHMEEIDMCWRIKNRGFRIVIEPKSNVFHVGGASLPKQSSRKLFLNFRNSLIMLHKNLNSNSFYKIMLTRMILDGMAAFKFLLSGEVSYFIAVLKAHQSYYKMLGTLRRKRKMLKQHLFFQAHKEMYSKSIIADYYIRKKRSFSQLKF
ncbi:glycosyltransferase family 2 protein [Ancylomarina longa]|uniref:Glycosyltransferase family 2 protein n=1 Tax=Ancylomarina longa TaxID=2487017 RepID=A0A434AGS4_9BACT|nr:glycosyltransferase family 2 protein [Ancylomarina longa]RUT73578.1 glycosyltransferase family 2 protein [Ancylomarina longa]